MGDAFHPLPLVAWLFEMHDGGNMKNLLRNLQQQRKSEREGRQGGGWGDGIGRQGGRRSLDSPRLLLGFSLTRGSSAALPPPALNLVLLIVDGLTRL